MYQWAPKALDETWNWAEGWEEYKGVRMYCVNCGIDGHFDLTGSIAGNLVDGLTTAAIRMKGNLDAGIYLGVYAHAVKEKEWETELITIPLSPFTIPEVITLGPELALSISLDITLDVVGEVLMGGDLSWPAINSVLDMKHPSKSYALGFKPQMSHYFEANGTATLTADLGLPLSFAVGLDVLNGKFKEELAIKDTPALELALTFTADFTDDNGETHPSINGDDGCYGFDWSLGLVNQVEFDIGELWSTQLYSTAGPAFATGCLGVSRPPAEETTTAVMSEATTNLALPSITSIDNFTGYSSTSRTSTTSKPTSPATTRPATTTTTTIITTTTATTASPTPTPYVLPDTCNNVGIQYAYYQLNSGVAPANIDLTYLKSETPITSADYDDIIWSIGGFSFDATSTGQFLLYGHWRNTQWFMLDHKFYHLAATTGTYVIDLPIADDEAYVWVGDNAYSGWNGTNWTLKWGSTTKTYTYHAEAGTYTPIRVLYGSGNAPGQFHFSLSAPDGSIVVDGTTPGSAEVLQFSCDGFDAPFFESWGSES
ncbi:hypothetical protein K461DRAFT_279329 [Myriangium duriaei CBS 260.36]|uniref:PA14 domain-containing protein n=1 Tax=Myriangium duriaei CBS 260.36 TaxID=1168546 RepID=A0A9P4J1Z9_9PEZI|nr:hypothetical protein K461DRAFT_279329 [Myriangium duriaei CBS 260.36]